MAKQPEPTPEPEGDKSVTVSMGALREMMVEVAKSVIPGAGKTEDPKTVEPGATAGQGDIAAEVQREVARLKEVEERTAKEVERDSTIQKLLEGQVQVQPIERRRVHRIMGWGDPDT
jgi:hypothetical protein